MSNPSNHTLNNHYVPRFYLSQWQSEEDSKKIWQYPKLIGYTAQDKWSLNSIETTASEYYLYSIPTTFSYQEEEAGIDDDLETAIGKVETAASQVIKRIAHSDYTLSSDEVTTLIMFVVLQFVRSRTWKNTIMFHRNKTILDILDISKLNQYIVGEQLFCPIERETVSLFIPFKEIVSKYDSVRTVDNSGNINYDDRYYAHQLAGAFVLFAKMAFAYRWQIIEFPNLTIPTSDNPFMVLKPDGKTLRKSAVFWDDDDILIMPLTPHHLIFACPNSQVEIEFCEDCAYPLACLIWENAYWSFYALSQDRQLFNDFHADFNFTKYAQRRFIPENFREDEECSDAIIGTESKDKHNRLIVTYSVSFRLPEIN